MSHDEVAHDERELPTGETLHLVKPPKARWRIVQYDWSWVDRDSAVLGLKTMTVYPEQVGWESMEFDTADDAYKFVADQVRQKRVPHRL